LQALQSATIVNAQLLRMEGKIGTLRPGAYADIVAVRGNPLNDVRALETPVWIMKGGEEIAGGTSAQ
jgi:imidazolonepropionase-like amidohydrolase